MSSLPPFLSPSLEEYPDYHPPKVPAWRRRWVQVTTASLVAFLVGIGVGGAGQATASPEQSGKVQKLTASLKDARGDAADVKDELADAQAEQERLADELETQQGKQRAAVAAVRAQAQASQRAAVRRAVTKVRAEKRRAVAAAAAQAKAQARAEAAAAAPAPQEANPGGGQTDPRFNYCYEANDAGYGDYQQGVDPEYDWYNDNDNDGFVCER